MGRIATGLLIALALAGCGRVGGESAMAKMPRDLGWENCPVELWLTGVIVRDTSGNAAIRDDEGHVYGLVWGTHNTATVSYGDRYKIGGKWFNPDFRFWACGGADAVIPL
jgi:hypothetical protein